MRDIVNSIVFGSAWPRRLVQVYFAISFGAYNIPG
jgi:hypothetical protein